MLGRGLYFCVRARVIRRWKVGGDKNSKGEGYKLKKVRKGSKVNKFWKC
jgi:hypothetical protein